MASPDDIAALVALMRDSGRTWAELSDALEELGSPLSVLEAEHGLLAGERASAELAAVKRWREEGIHPVTILDPDYPDNLRGVHDRPPLLFVRGRLLRSDRRALAIVGSRHPGEAGSRLARAFAEHLLERGYAIVSGLAAGIDTAAHLAALERGARTIAVIGTGLHHAYPAENRELQQRIADAGAVVSPFTPDQRPSRATFPIRNAVMSGLSLGTLIVEAGPRSGTRIQARHALAHGRPVFLARRLITQPWARELSDRAGVHVVDSPSELTETIEQLTSTNHLTE